MNLTITDDVRDVLKRCRTDGNKLFFPDGRMPTELYKNVDKVLANLGGKWTRGVGGHVFPGDAAKRLQEVLQTGVARNLKKERQALYTPEDLAIKIVNQANVLGCHVLEPSIGSGSLANAALLQGAKHVTGIEIDAGIVEALGHPHDVTLICKDFLQVKPSPIYDRVVMHPPFAGGKDLVHVRHAFKFLKPGGRLVAIMSAGMKSRDLVEILQMGKKAHHTSIPAAAFKEVGTQVDTMMVTIDK